jgi:hypothetical protein
MRDAGRGAWELGLETQAARPVPRFPRPDFWLVCALLLALIAAAPLWSQPGLLNTRGGGDSPFLLFRLYELSESLRVGVFPVRWMPDAAYGYGFPFFNYYAALPYYFAALLRLAGFSLVAALKAVQAAGFVLAAAGMYAWARRALGSAPAAWAASAAYTFAPFHLVNVYVRGDSLSEFYAFAWYPLILLALDRVIERPAPGRAALPAAGSATALALAYGALLMTHNVSALIFTPFVALYAVVLLLRARASWRAWAVAAGAGLLGAALAAWVWAPALGEGAFVQLEVQTTGYFNYAQHFRALDLVQPGPVFQYGTGSRPTPFAMGLVQALLASVGALALAWRAWRARDAHAALALAGLLLATLMITPLARPLYERVPLLAFVQFPWRFLSVQALFASLAVGGLLVYAKTQGSNDAKPATLPAAFAASPPWRDIIAAVVLVLFLAIPQLIALPLDFLAVSDADVTPERLQQYELFTGNIGTTIRAEYLPRAVVPRPYTSGALVYGAPDPARVIAGRAQAGRLARRPDAQSWAVQAESPGATVAFPVLYFPGWEASIDGQPAPVRALDGLGWITLDVPEGTHDVTLQLARTPLRAAAEAVSAVALVLVAGLLAAEAFLPQRRRGTEVPQRNSNVEAAAPAATQQKLRAFSAPLCLCGEVAAALLLALLVSLLAERPPAARTDNLVWDFAARPYLAPGPLRYTYSADTLRLGDALTVTLDWPGHAPNLALVPAGCQIPREIAPGCPWIADTAGPALYVPTHAPPGLYLPRVRDGAAEFYLRPVRVTPLLSDNVVIGDTPVDVALIGAGDYSAGDTRAMLVTLNWQPRAAMHADDGLSLRLSDAAGNEWAARDTLAGLDGFYPSALWRPLLSFRDQVALPIPDGLPPAVYTLTVTLYDRGTLAPVMPPVALALDWPHATLRPDAPLVARLGALGVAGVDAPAAVVQGESIALTARFVALAALPADARLRWELRDAAGGTAYALDASLVPGADPARWPHGAYVLGRHTLAPPADFPPGVYTLRLVVGDEHVDLPDALAVTGRPRVFAVPPLGVTLNADYGGVIRLHGYTLARDGDRLTLTLAWGALQAPGRSYKVFVHLFDPASDAIPAQHDDFPRGGAYPTDQWVAGEVVTDVVTLDLSGVPPGRYRLGVGLYDPDDPSTRLGERVVLPDEVVR